MFPALSTRLKPLKLSLFGGSLTGSQPRGRRRELQLIRSRAFTFLSHLVCSVHCKRRTTSRAQLSHECPSQTKHLLIEVDLAVFEYVSRRGLSVAIEALHENHHRPEHRNIREKEHHPHVHFIVPTGGLTADQSMWISGVFLLEARCFYVSLYLKCLNFFHCRSVSSFNRSSNSNTSRFTSSWACVWSPLVDQG
jgi:hypothetical protein